MRQAMVVPPVGDDVFDEDPTVHALQERVAALLGHEAGLFVVTGSIGNQLGVAAHVRPGQEVLCDSGAHIARAELGAHGVLHGATMRTWVTADGMVDVDQVAHLLAPDAGPYLVSTACVALGEHPQLGGGTVQPPSRCRPCTRCAGTPASGSTSTARGCGTPTSPRGCRQDPWPPVRHRERVPEQGARRPGGLGARGVARGDRGGAGAAQGSRRRLAPGGHARGGRLYALDHHVDRLAGDHAAARAFADAVGRHGVRVTNPPTNIVVVETGARPAKQVVADAAAHGVRSRRGPRVVRAVTHLDVTAEECAEAGDVVGVPCWRRSPQTGPAASRSSPSGEHASARVAGEHQPEAALDDPLDLDREAGLPRAAPWPRRRTCRAGRRARPP